MADQPLRIGVEVNVGDLSKLADASGQVANSVTSMAEQFTKAGLSANQIAQAVTSVAESFIKANPSVLAQTTGLIELRTALSAAQAALKETSAIIQEAGGMAGTGASMLKQLGVETKVVADLQSILKTATQQVNTAMSGTVGAATEAAAATQRHAATAVEAAEASAIQAKEVQAATIALSEAGIAAKETAEAIVAGSEEVQVAGDKFITLTRDLSVLNAELAATRREMLSAAATEEQLEAAATKYGEQLAAVQLITRQATEAEREFKAALADSYEAVQVAGAAKVEAAQAETEGSLEKAAASQAAADATTQEAAATQASAAADANAAQQKTAIADASIRSAAANQSATAATQQNSAAVAGNAAATVPALSGLAKMIKSLMDQGMSAKDATDALKQNGMTAQQAAEAFAELGLATEKVTFDMGGLGGETQNTTVKIDAMTRAMAYSGTRIAAGELGVGQLGFALARLGSISETLAPILASIFPIFAAFAFIQIIGMANEAMQKLADESQKSADAEAKFERDMLKSAEAVDKMNEKIAGQISPLAQLAEEMANAGHKAVDLSSDMSALNTRIEDLPGSFSIVGRAWQSMTDVFIGQSGQAAREVNQFTRELADETHTIQDLPGAIQRVSQEIGKLIEEEQKYRDTQVWTDQGIEKYNALIDALGRLETSMVHINQASDLSTFSQQIAEQEKMVSEFTRFRESQIALWEAQDKNAVKLHLSTIEDEQRKEITLENQKGKLLIDEVSNREANLRKLEAQEAASGRQVDHSGAFKAMEDEKLRYATETARKIDEIVFSTNQQIESRDLAHADAEINANEKIAAARIKAAEAQEKIAFSHADTPAAIESASIPMIRTANALYDEQIKKLQLRAEELLKTLPASTPKPTAAPGSDEFSKQLELAKATAGPIYDQVLALNAEIIAANANRSATEEEIENQKVRKIKEIRSQGLTDMIAELNQGLVAERQAYQDGTIALQASIAVEHGGKSRYFSDIQALAEKNYSETMAILEKEISSIEQAYLDETLSATEAQKKIEVAKKKEEEASKEKDKRELDSAKEAIKKEQEEIDQMANKISQDFVKMANTIMTTHTSIGKAAMQLGRELEIGIIDQGIKRIVVYYAQGLLKMLAEESSWMARILGIHTAGASAQKTIDAANLAAHKTAVEAQTAVDVQASAQATIRNQAGQAQFATVQTAETAILKTAVAARNAIEQTDLSTGSPASSAAAEGKVQQDIGQAASDVFLQTIEGVPWPANLAAAPAAAYNVVSEMAPFAAMAAGGGAAAAGASFAQGGIVKANLHEGEMVLPPALSAFVMRSAATAAANGGSQGGSTMVNHHHYNIKVDGRGQSMDQLSEMIHSAIVPAMKRAIRQGNFPSIPGVG